MNLSMFGSRARALAPALAFCALLIATMVLENAIPTAMVHSTPDMGQGCYCHTGAAAAITLNGTAASDFIARVGTGASFALQTKFEFYQIPSTAQKVAWMPNMSDNSKFLFSPAEVVDNSQLDQDPRLGYIVTFFKITAPNASGSFQIALSVLGSVTTMAVDVGIVSETIAAIARVDAPLASRAGDMVRVNITLQNNGSVPGGMYVYGTNGSKMQVMFAKVRSTELVLANGTTTLSGAFEMPNSTLTLTIRSGHQDKGSDVDDDRFTINILQSLSSPPIQRTPFGVLANGWAPWIAVMAVSLGAVPFLAMYGRNGKRLFRKAEKLKMAFVDCTRCALCRTAIAELEENALHFLPQKTTLAPIATSAGEREPIDVAFVLGSIRTADDVEAVKELREKAKVLVAFGACAAFGAWHPGDRRRVDAITRRLRKPASIEEVPELNDDVRPVSDYVKVDLSVPGCPPPVAAVRGALETTLCDVASNGRSDKNA